MEEPIDPKMREFQEKTKDNSQRNKNRTKDYLIKLKRFEPVFFNEMCEEMWARKIRNGEVPYFTFEQYLLEYYKRLKSNTGQVPPLNPIDGGGKRRRRRKDNSGKKRSGRNRRGSRTRRV